MTSAAEKPPLLPSRMSAPTQKQALRQLFMTLFLRGRGARGLNVKGAPKSIGKKFFLILCFYTFFGLVALYMIHQPLFTLAIYLHAMTFAFLGMFIASSAGEILFNKEEVDILLHRPVDSRTMLWAKIRVLVEVSFWIAGAFNFAGLFIGVAAADGSWWFPLVHAMSTVLEALFCTGCVVLMYQLCLHWFGRERLEGFMTTTQVIVSIAAVMGSQLLPRFIGRFGGTLTTEDSAWWFALLPPTWFAGLDDALAGSHARISWYYGAGAVVATGIVLWLAFSKLAQVYERGLQMLNEASFQRKPAKAGRRWLQTLITLPPLRWWLRDPVSRASFLLVTAYLVRDRDVKLRVYPGIAPMLVFPFIFIIQQGLRMGDFGIAFSGAYLGLIPLLALNMLKYSQQWQASDIFLVAPMRGPAPIYHGARRAVLCFLTLPMLLAVIAVLSLVHGINSKFLLLLPGTIALPAYSLVPGLMGRAIPLSSPTEEAKSANRSTVMWLISVISAVLSVIATFAWDRHLFWQFVLGETIIVGGLYAWMRYAIERMRWASAE